MDRILRRSMGVFAVVMVLLLAPVTAQAHPHILPTVAAVITFDRDARVSTLRQTWTYDVMYSTFALRDIDANKDGVISAEELASFAKEQLDAMAEYSYFTTASTPAGKLEFGSVQFDQFSKLDDGKLQLTFTLPFKVKTKIAKQLVVQMFDPNFFAYFTMVDGGVRLDGPHGNCTETAAGPQPLDLRNTRTVPTLFWKALDGSKEAGQAFVNRITVTCP